MSLRRVLGRLVPLGGTLALVLSMTAGPVALADTYTGSGGLTADITGGPVYLQANDPGVSCSDPTQAGAPAHLSGPLTITITQVRSDYDRTFGDPAGEAVVGHNSGYADGGFDTFTFVVPVGGGGASGNGFTCQDAQGAELPVTISAVGVHQVCGPSGCFPQPVTDTISTTLTLTAVD